MALFPFVLPLRFLSLRNHDSDCMVLTNQLTVASPSLRERQWQRNVTDLGLDETLSETRIMSSCVKQYKKMRRIGGFYSIALTVLEDLHQEAMVLVGQAWRQRFAVDLLSVIIRKL
ncbi:hypothetical protein SDJN03_30029, partial [Cucurbita argyrosperma subsp. sororia]